MTVQELTKIALRVQCDGRYAAAGHDGKMLWSNTFDSLGYARRYVMDCDTWVIVEDYEAIERSETPNTETPVQVALDRLMRLTRADRRVNDATTIDEVHAALADVGLAVVTHDRGDSHPQSRWSAKVSDAYTTTSGVGTTELQAAQVTAHNAMLALTHFAQTALYNAWDEENRE